MVEAVELCGEAPQPRIGNDILNRAAAGWRNSQYDLAVLDTQPMIANFGDCWNPQASARWQKCNLSSVAGLQDQLGGLGLAAPNIQSGWAPGHRSHKRRQVGQAAALRQQAPTG